MERYKVQTRAGYGSAIAAILLTMLMPQGVFTLEWVMWRVAWIIALALAIVLAWSSLRMLNRAIKNEPNWLSRDKFNAEFIKKNLSLPKHSIGVNFILVCYGPIGYAEEGTNTK